MIKKTFEELLVGDVVVMNANDAKKPVHYLFVLEKDVNLRRIKVDMDNTTSTFEIEKGFQFDVIGTELEPVDKKRFLKTVMFSENCKMYQLNSNATPANKLEKKHDLKVAIRRDDDVLTMYMHFGE